MQVVVSSTLVAVLAAAPPAAVQRFWCSPIQPGETAAQSARRLTGDPLNQRATWFQIFDGHRRLVPKARYDAIQTGWRACVAEAQSPPAQATRPIEQADALSGVELGAILVSLVLAAMCGLGFAAHFWKKYQEVATAMRRFGGDFVREFARPWTQYRSAGPLPRTRLRIAPVRARMDILVAPSQGHTYPNLADHRRNVEYDVARVTAALKQESFAIGRLYAEGEWVVLPFHLKGVSVKEGVR